MNVVVYSTPTCSFCHQAKAFLSRQGIRYTEKNVASNRKAATEMVRLSGQQGVPVITVDGEVVIGFNQPRLMQLLKKTKSGPKFGVSIADAASQARKRPGIPSSGAYVGGVRSGSPAAKAGLRSGDVITALGGQTVVNAANLHRLVREMPQGHDVSLSFVRKGNNEETLVRL